MSVSNFSSKEVECDVSVTLKKTMQASKLDC